MTREIKFRAWDKDTEQGMFYGGFSIHSTGKIQSDMFNVESLIVMQYTGLKDKNGVEIYEGDIVNHLFHKEPFKVIWNEKNCSFIALYLGGRGRYSEGIKDKLLQVDNVWYEVIGNVHQNPELLS